MLDFLWSSTKPKIAYTVLTQDIEHGGLGLPDLDTRVSTAHIRWMARLWLSPETPWAEVLKHHLKLSNVRDSIICKTNFARHLPDQLYTLKVIMQNWAKFRIFQPWDEDGIKNETIWANDFITVEGKTLDWSEWRQAGINLIYDLWHHSSPRFLSDTEIRQKYGVRCSFINLLQIRSALPSHWKRQLQTSNTQPQAPKAHILVGDQSVIDVANSSSKNIYKALIRQKGTQPAAEARWLDLVTSFDPPLNDQWQWIYKLPYRTTRETKLQAFQFRLLHRIIPCNRYLSNIRIRQDDLCTHCGTQDNLQHFFFLCALVQDFWKKISTWLADNANFHLPLSLEEVLFGKPIQTPVDKASNFIILFSKFFIYRQRLFHGSELNLLHFLMELRSKLKVERYISHREGKPAKFKIWTPILEALG